MVVGKREIILVGLWTTAFALLLSIFYLTIEVIMTHIGPEKENVDIFVKLPIVLTGIGMIWALCLLVFGYMTVKLKNGTGNANHGG